MQTHRKPNLTFRKIGQGQPRRIIYMKFVELESQMLHTKSLDHRALGSEEEGFLGFLPKYGIGGHLGQVTKTILYKFLPLFTWRLHIKSGFD